MHRRAILLVHGGGTFPSGERQAALATALRLLNDFRFRAPAAISVEGERCFRLSPLADEVDTPEIDVFEAYWIDKAFPRKTEGKLEALFSATATIGYWLFHSWWVGALRRALVLGIFVALVSMLLWYLAVVFALGKLVLDGLIAWKVGGEALQGWAVGTFDKLGTMFALVGVLSTFAGFEAIAQICGFARNYLGGGSRTLLAKEIGQIVRDRLETIYAVKEGEDPRYVDVLVVGHSMGAVIALETLAAYKNPNISRTMLVTWGSPLEVVRHRSRRVAQAIEAAVLGSVPRWLDFYSHQDWLSTELRALKMKRPEASRRLRFQRAWWTGLSREAHNQYYQDDEALSVLVRFEKSAVASTKTVSS